MVDVSGIDITPYKTMGDAVKSILDENGRVVPGFAIALNAEKIIAMRKDPKIKAVLKTATLRYPDGIGVVWVLKRKGFECARIPGCDLWVELMKASVRKKTKVYLVGAKPDVMERTRNKLINQMGVNLIGHQHGYFECEETLISNIVNSDAKIVTVAMGSPAQENFIAKCRIKHPNAFYMGVGGTYDVFVGEVRRAPIWAQKYNIEWLYRVMNQPSRIFRQFALLKFFMLLLLNKL